MPVHFIGQLGSTKRRGSRGRHFDEAIATLAPTINGFRAAGVHDVRKLAACLNDAGVPAPSGGRFTYGTLYRVLVRLRQLHLGMGPRTLSAAASQRPYKSRPGRPMRLSNSTLKKIHAIDPSF